MRKRYKCGVCGKEVRTVPGRILDSFEVVTEGAQKGSRFSYSYVCHTCRDRQDLVFVSLKVLQEIAKQGCLVDRLEVAQ